jgi:TonB family protein
MSRRWLIAVSTVAHVAVGVGLFVTGVWQIDQLDRPRLSIALGQPPPPPPPPAGGPVAAVKNIDVTPKPPPHRPPPVIVQPNDKAHEKPAEPGPNVTTGPVGPGEPESPCLENCGPPAAAVAPVCGNNSLEVGEQCDDGNTISNDGCSSTCQTEPRPKPPTAVVSPNVMTGLRISGDTQIHPSSSTQNRMSRDGKTEVIGSVQLCISTDGSIASASTLKPTRYDDYDQALLSAVRSWRYRPYTVNGVAVKACSLVSFHYSIH